MIQYCWESTCEQGNDFISRHVMDGCNHWFIISTVVRSGLPTGGLPQCREVEFTRWFIMRSGLPTGGLPRCREVGSIQQIIYCFHGREVGFTNRWFATMS